MVFMEKKENARRHGLKTFPSEHDKYAGWAKRIGELQAEAFKEYNS